VGECTDGMFTKIMDVELGRETAGATLDMNSGREDEEGDEFAKSGSMCRRCARKTVRCRAHIHKRRCGRYIRDTKKSHK